MISVKIRHWLAAVVAAITLTACGGGIGLDENSSIHQPSQEEVRETAIEKIKAYAISDGSNSDIPQIQDYQDAGVSGVDEENLEDINRIISGLTAEDVNSSDKIQSLIDKFKLVIDIPIMISENNVSVYENNITAIKLFAIGKDTVYYHIYDLDRKYFDLNTTTGLVVFRKAPDYERKRSYRFYATTAYSSGITSAQVPITITILDREESTEITYRGTEYNTVLFHPTQAEYGWTEILVPPLTVLPMMISAAMEIIFNGEEWQADTRRHPLQQHRFRKTNLLRAVIILSLAALTGSVQTPRGYCASQSGQ